MKTNYQSSDTRLYTKDEVMAKLKDFAEKEIIELEKILQRLKKYACGHHKELQNQIENRIKKLMLLNGDRCK